MRSAGVEAIGAADWGAGSGGGVGSPLREGAGWSEGVIAFRVAWAIGGTGISGRERWAGHCGCGGGGGVVGDWRRSWDRSRGDWRIGSA